MLVLSHSLAIILFVCLLLLNLPCFCNSCQTVHCRSTKVAPIKSLSNVWHELPNLINVFTRLVKNITYLIAPTYSSPPIALSYVILIQVTVGRLVPSQVEKDWCSASLTQQKPPVYDNKKPGGSLIQQKSPVYDLKRKKKDWCCSEQLSTLKPGKGLIAFMIYQKSPV